MARVILMGGGRNSRGKNKCGRHEARPPSSVPGLNWAQNSTCLILTWVNIRVIWYLEKIYDFFSSVSWPKWPLVTREKRKDGKKGERGRKREGQRLPSGCHQACVVFIILPQAVTVIQFYMREKKSQNRSRLTEFSPSQNEMCDSAVVP